MIGLERGIVRIEDYDSQWPVYYQEERAGILPAAFPLPVALEHIGSTSVEGLCAKPIIDILVGIDNFEQGFGLVPGFERIGYKFKGESGIPRRHFFTKGNPATHHVHMVEKGSNLQVDHLFFREYLRRNPRERCEYATLKKRLAGSFSRGSDRHTDSKAAFIQTAIRKARSEEGC